MAKITQTVDYYQIDGDAQGTGVIQINGTTATTTITGAATITAGLTVSTGGATITAGGLTVTAGGATITAGDVGITAGNLQLDTGNLDVQAGQVTIGAFGPGIVVSDPTGVLASTATTDGALLIGNAVTGFSELAAGNAGRFPVDSGSAFASVAASGDMGLAAGGAFTAASPIITGKTAETSVDNADLVLIYDNTAGALRQMTRANFVAGVSGSPGGSNTQIQYNNAGSFGGDSGFTTDGAGGLALNAGSLDLTGGTRLTLDTTGTIDAPDATISVLATVGAGGAANINLGGANATLEVANLTVDGTLTYLDTTNLRIEDKLIDLNSNAAGAGVASNAGGGINLLSSTGSNTITFTALSDGGAMSSSSGLDVATGKVYSVAGTTVLTATTLGSGVVNSSLTSVGTIATGVWNGTVIGSAYGGTGQDFSGSSGAISVSSGTFSAGTLSVANGGTGATTLTDGGILLGSGTGAITATAQPTNGQLLIGATGSDPVLATLTAGDGITVTNASGAITIAADTSGAKVTGTYTASGAYNIDFTIPSGTRTNVGFRATVYLEDSTTANSALVTIEGIVIRSSGAPLLPDFLFVVVPGTDGDKISLGTGGANTLRISGGTPAGSGNYVATVTWTED
jgi:hypothetical protein